eukprot:2164654-Pyramimonas_sp.AAC.1
MLISGALEAGGHLAAPFPAPRPHSARKHLAQTSQRLAMRLGAESELVAEACEASRCVVVAGLQRRLR